MVGTVSLVPPQTQNGAALCANAEQPLTTITFPEATMAAQSIPDWDNLEDDSRYVYEALAKLGYGEFNTLPLPDMSLALALALHLKRTQGKSEMWES